MRMFFNPSSKVMAHSTVWGYLPIQKQNKTSKKLTEEKLSENGLSKYTKFGQAHLNDGEKNKKTFVDLASCVGFPDLI